MTVFNLDDFSSRTQKKLIESWATTTNDIVELLSLAQPVPHKKTRKTITTNEQFNNVYFGYKEVSELQGYAEDKKFLPN